VTTTPDVSGMHIQGGERSRVRCPRERFPVQTGSAARSGARSSNVSAASQEDAIRSTQAAFERLPVDISSLAIAVMAFLAVAGSRSSFKFAGAVSVRNIITFAAPARL